MISLAGPVLRLFLHARGGNVALITALAAIPMMAALGLAVDYGRSYRAETELQQIADSASLYAAGAQDVTGTPGARAEKRKALAISYLNTKLTSLTDMEIVGFPAVKANADTVEVVINAQVKGSFINALKAYGSGKDQYDIDFRVGSIAKFGADAYSCMLALNSSASQSMSFQGNATLLGVKCRVQANSNNAVAISLQGASSLSASEICSVGGASGSKYTPTPTTCPAKSDPYADLVMPTADASCNTAFTNVAVRNTTRNLTPGTYCGGIAIQSGGTANMAPGLYIIKDGMLSAASNSVINAPSGVTIYLTGNASKIDIASGASVTIVAPNSVTADSTTMPYRSIAIMQDRATGIGNINQISSKGGVNITGAYYTPKQKLSITANGSMNADSPYFPVVVDTLSAGGTGDLYVKFDYETPGFDNPIPLMTKGKVSVVR